MRHTSTVPIFLTARQLAVTRAAILEDMAHPHDYETVKALHVVLRRIDQGHGRRDRRVARMDHR